jgi:hypothetical protein
MSCQLTICYSLHLILRAITAASKNNRGENEEKIAGHQPVSSTDLVATQQAGNLASMSDAQELLRAAADRYTYLNDGRLCPECGAVCGTRRSQIRTQTTDAGERVSSIAVAYGCKTCPHRKVVRMWVRE